MNNSEQFMSTLVPPSVAKDLATDGGEVTSLNAVSRKFFAAVLFIDISDFTPMTEKFERLGPEGVEQLTSALNRYFGIMIEEITTSGGEIDNLSGDGLMAYWPADDGCEHLPIINTALVCAARLQERMAGSLLEDGTRVSVHSALVAGPLQRLYLGGHLGHRLCLLTGEPLDRISQLLDAAGPGELVLDEMVCNYLKDDIEGEILANGGRRLTGFPVNHSMVDAGTAATKATRPLREAAPYLHHFLQNRLSDRIAAGQVDWLAELRHLTVTFVSLDDLDFGSHADFERIQEIILAMQTAVHDYGGAVQSLTVDDKGVVFFAAFGLPLLAHEDDTVRAIAAMQSIREQLMGMGYGTTIGICSGMTYCGILGTDDWRCYSVRGTVTNRAARLMSHKSGRIYVDSTARRAAKGRVEFEKPRSVDLKGIDEPVDIWTVGHEPVQSRTLPREDAFIGRADEIANVDRELTAFLTQPEPRVLMIEGVPGVGKTTLLDEAARRAETKGLRVLRGGVDALDLGAVYAALRSVFQDLVGLEPHDSQELRNSKIANRLGGEPSWMDRSPLLATVLQIPMQDNDLTRQMDSVSRADNTNAMLRFMLDKAAAERQLAIIIDDCQWMDTATWKLVQQLSDTGSNIMLILGVRSDRELSQSAVETLLSAPRTKQIVLGEVDRETVRGLVCSNLDVDHAPESLVDFVHSRGGGNPYFTCELVQALHEQNFITVKGRDCLLNNGSVDLASISFPDTVERVIVSRVDRLEPDLQLTLKVASVIGRQFPFDALFGVHPLSPELEELREQLNEIENRDFTPILPESPQLTYYFRHLLMHQTVYGLLAFSSRRELHQAVGSWIEQNVEGARVTQKVTLAHHWTMAVRPDVAVNYLEQAGDEADNSGAYAEAVSLYDRAIAALQESSPKPDVVREARIYFGLGDIYTRLGDIDKSHASYRLGLEGLGIRWPKNGFQLALAVIKAVSRQAWHRFKGMNPDVNQPVKQRELVLANGMEKFGNLFFFTQRLNDLVLTTLLGLNFSELANSPANIRKTFAQMSVSLSIAKLNKWADYYAGRVESLPLQGSTDNDLAFQFVYLGMHSIGQGRFSEAQRYLREGLGLAKKIGNKRLVLDLTAFSRSPNFLQADYEQGYKDNEVYRDAVLASDDKQHQYFMRIALGEFALRMSDLETANRLLREAREILLPGYQMDKLHVISMLAISEHRLGNAAVAWDLANEALDAIKSTPPIGYYAMDAYAGIAGLFLEYLEDSDFKFDLSRNELLKRARRALKGFDGFSRSFAVSRPQYLVMQGRLHLLMGNERKAISSSRAAVEMAEDFDMQYDIAIAELQLGRMSSFDLETRMSHVNSAISRFQAIGLRRETDQARQALDSIKT